MMTFHQKNSASRKILKTRFPLFTAGIILICCFVQSVRAATDPGVSKGASHLDRIYQQFYKNINGLYDGTRQYVEFLKKMKTRVTARLDPECNRKLDNYLETLKKFGRRTISTKHAVKNENLCAGAYARFVEPFCHILCDFFKVNQSLEAFIANSPSDKTLKKYITAFLQNTRTLKHKFHNHIFVQLKMDHLSNDTTWGDLYLRCLAKLGFSKYLTPGEFQQRRERFDEECSKLREGATTLMDKYNALQSVVKNYHIMDHCYPFEEDDHQNFSTRYNENMRSKDEVFRLFEKALDDNRRAFVAIRVQQPRDHVDNVCNQKYDNLVETFTQLGTHCRDALSIMKGLIKEQRSRSIKGLDKCEKLVKDLERGVAAFYRLRPEANYGISKARSKILANCDHKIEELPKELVVIEDGEF